MRRTILGLAVTFALVSCSGGDSAGPGGGLPPPPPPPPPAPPPPPPTFSVSGVVVDSLTTEGVEGADVRIAGLTTTSDFLGSYQVNSVPEGTHRLEVVSSAHRPFSADLDVRANTTRNVRLWRLAPYLSLLLVDARTTTTWIDLDGDFPQQSFLKFSGPGFVVLAGSTSNQSVDATTRRYFFPTTDGASQIETSLKDLAGHSGIFTCLPAWTCVEEPSSSNPPPPPPPPPSGDVVVEIENIAFVAPDGSDVVTIQLGSTVTWVNRDQGIVHTVTSTDVPVGGDSFDSGLLVTDATFVFEPNVKGTWIYRCEVHPGDMFDAKIIVQ